MPISLSGAFATKLFPAVLKVNFRGCGIDWECWEYSELAVVELVGEAGKQHL